MSKYSFNVIYGSNIVSEFVNNFKVENTLIVTMENLWEMYSYLFPQSSEVVFIKDMELNTLEKMTSDISSNVINIIGFGGGMVIDSAKYFAWKKGITTYFIPTIISVDACFSYPVAVRINNNVKYIGENFPDKIIVDFDIIQNAPIHYNRAGLGDLLSCHTALYDWNLMKKNSIKEVNQSLQYKASNILNDIFNNPEEIKNVTQKGIKMIIEGYKWVGIESYKAGHCHFEEGSEHYFAYALESINKGHLIHGQIVCLGVYIMSLLQKNNPDKVLNLIEQVGLSIHPNDIGVSFEEIREALKILNKYVITEKLSYSIINTEEITNSFINMVIEKLKEIEQI